MKTREIIFKLLELETDGFKDDKKLATLATDVAARQKLLAKAEAVVDLCDKFLSQ